MTALLANYFIITGLALLCAWCEGGLGLAWGEM